MIKDTSGQDRVIATSAPGGSRRRLLWIGGGLAGLAAIVFLLSRLEVELEIPESYADDLGLGMNVEVNIGSTQATGKLSALSPEVVRNQLLARVRYDGQQPAGLRQSQRLTARILIEEKPDVLMLPRGPFVENEGGRAAYVMDGDLAVRRPIQIGATSVSAVEIVSGLQAGERVVVSGTDAFENAERIAINN